jgi:uncharacterized protein
MKLFIALALLGTATPYTTTQGELRVLPREREDRQYQLYIGLPASYGREPERRYPVVYVTDGYWHYDFVHAVCGGLLYDKTLPEVIVVGIGYAGENLNYDMLRGFDLVPPLRVNNMYFGKVTGGADHFLHVLETQVIPLMEQEYRGDAAHRILAGGSLGGLFTLYAMYSRPELFQGYVATSPSLSLLWQYEEAFHRSGRTIAGKVFVSVGSNESRTYQREIDLFQQRLSQRTYLKGGFRFQLIDGMRHGGAINQGFIAGIQSVAEPLAPERGVDAEVAPELAHDYYAIEYYVAPLLPTEAMWNKKQKQAMRAHRERLDQFVADKKIVFNVRTRDDGDTVSTTVGLQAGSPAEAEKFAAEDPAVRAGMLTFEVLELSGPKR